MKQKTYYHIILDQSGSMQDCKDNTISGLNEQLQMIQSLQHRFPEQEILVGLTRFNQEVMHSFFARDSQSVSCLTRETYIPNGSTALLDAIGITVLKLKEDIQRELTHDNATAVVVIITDGYENASKLFTLKGIKHLISELEATGKWTFSYLGATMDAIEVAASMNIKSQNSMAFDKGNMKKTLGRINESLDDYLSEKSSGNISGDFLKKGKY